MHSSGPLLVICAGAPTIDGITEIVPDESFITAAASSAARATAIIAAQQCASILLDQILSDDPVQALCAVRSQVEFPLACMTNSQLVVSRDGTQDWLPDVSQSCIRDALHTRVARHLHPA